MDYSKQNIQALSQIDGYDDKVEPHQLTFEINETIGRQSNAIYHLNQKMAFKDSLMNETKVKETQNLQIQCKGQGNRGKRTSTCFAQHQGEAEQEKVDLFHHHLGFVVVLCEPPLLQVFGEEKIKCPAPREEQVDILTKGYDQRYEQAIGKENAPGSDEPAFYL